MHPDIPTPDRRLRRSWAWFAIGSRTASRLFLLALAVAIVQPLPVSAQDAPSPFALELEGAGLWLGRNDVRIPNDQTATEFSLVDVVGSSVYGAIRATADINFNERHGLRLVAAPLRVREAGVLVNGVAFAGDTFGPGPIDATYKFSSYRLSYRYRFFAGDRWQWRVGFTGFVRHARVALEREGQLAEDTNIGFVPLLHLEGQARLSPRWRFIVDLDGLAATQGRAFDIAARLAYQVAEHWDVAVGYRTIEGGADVEDVFNFAWLNFATASVRYSF